MNNKKTVVLFLSLIGILLILVGIIFLKNLKPLETDNQKRNLSFQEEFLENSFEAREEILSGVLSQSRMLNLDLNNISTSIIAESNTHVLGTYNSIVSEEEAYGGFFIGLLNEGGINIAWTGEVVPDCETLLSFNISENIAPHCFR